MHFKQIHSLVQLILIYLATIQSIQSKTEDDIKITQMRHFENHAKRILRHTEQLDLFYYHGESSRLKIQQIEHRVSHFCKRHVCGTCTSHMIGKRSIPDEISKMHDGYHIKTLSELCPRCRRHCNI